LNLESIPVVLVYIKSLQVGSAFDLVELLLSVLDLLNYLVIEAGGGDIWSRMAEDIPSGPICWNRRPGRVRPLLVHHVGLSTRIDDFLGLVKVLLDVIGRFGLNSQSGVDPDLFLLCFRIQVEIDYYRY
jgi:hypothetical protein